MKMTKGWPAHKRPHKIVRIKDNRSIPWKTLGLTDPTEEQRSRSMDEIRQQVLMMSAQEIGQGFEEIEYEESPKSSQASSRSKTEHKTRTRASKKQTAER
ncbi:MAG: hypothetical protein MRJ96_15915 [Nitrospirales bacterium]|nr:hypothetical protein [Nitrospira sp.]MDR4502931.1 hypothetical protein [Nitrospirales bacterium]